MLRQLGLVPLLLFLAAGCPLGGEPAAPPVKPPAGKAPVKPTLTSSHGTILKVEIAGVPELSGRFWSGDLLCLPPACKVTLVGPASGGGPPDWQLTDRGRWKKAGGTTTKLKGGGIELFSPQVSGDSFSLKLTFYPPSAADKGNPGTKVVFPIVILHEAEITRTKKTGAWRVKVGKHVIGTYPNPEKAKSWRVRKHKHLFNPPRFWMRITPKNEKLLMAPHVTVGQMVGFITQKNKKKPKRRHTSWFPPNRHFIYKMEMLSRELLARKVKFKRLAVNSAFRAPYYNRRVGGGIFSRHIYGDAADVMIDEDGDEVCDDITGDGKVDEKDGLVIGHSLRKLEKAGRVRTGGTGVYAFDGPESCRSYVHFDARGYLTRWGTLRKRGKRRTLEWWPPAEYNEDEEPPPEFREAPGKKVKKDKKVRK